MTAALEAGLEGCQKISTELGNLPEDQSQQASQRNTYGTFKADVKEDADHLQCSLNNVVKLLSAIAISGVLISHLGQPQFLSVHGNSGRLVSPAMNSSTRQTSSPIYHFSVSGHCMDVAPDTCASWFEPNAQYNSTAMCAADQMRKNPICPRSCGCCALMLSGCKKLKIVDIGQNCVLGEDIVGEVCDNDDLPGESYCTYMPPAVDGVKATFACGLCQDPLSEASPERRVILSQMMELRAEEISREDERILKKRRFETHENVAANKVT